MRGAIGVAALGVAYFLSQFYRAFLAVLSGPLERDVGVDAVTLSDAQAAWFLTFAAAQFPIGWALDRIGPRRVASLMLALGGGGGAAAFATADSGEAIVLAMGLIGLGCAPALMASLYIYAREFEPSRFAFYAAVLIGAGTLGNVAASGPLAWAAETVGWRACAWAVAAVSVLVALAVGRFVLDPPILPARPGGGLLEVLRIRALWWIMPLMAVNYAAAASLRGLWAGPYFSGVHGYDDAAIGLATTAMALAMAVGNFFYAPLDRWFGTRKGVVLAGNAVVFAACLALVFVPPGGDVAAGALYAVVGFFGVSYAVIMAHGRAFFPPDLVGRGVTLLNFCSIGGVAALQFASGRVLDAWSGDGGQSAGFAALYGFYAGTLLASLIVYLGSRDAKP